MNSTLEYWYGRKRNYCIETSLIFIAIGIIIIIIITFATQSRNLSWYNPRCIGYGRRRSRGKEEEEKEKEEEKEGGRSSGKYTHTQERTDWELSLQ